MGLTLAQKLIKAHLVEGEMIPGTEIGLRIDQTLTQDATGTMAYLEFEAMGVRWRDSGTPPGLAERAPFVCRKNFRHTKVQLAVI